MKKAVKISEARKKQLRDIDDAHWSYHVDVHRSAIEAGGEDALPLLIITTGRCNESNRPRPEWLNAVLAEWAAAYLTDNSEKLKQWPEPKKGRRANRSTNVKQLKSDLNIRGIYEAGEVGLRIGRINNSQFKNVSYRYDVDRVKIVAAILGISKSTLTDALDRTEKYAKEISILGPDGKQSRL